MADTDNSSTPSEPRINPMLVAIGSVVIAWADLEHQINRAIWGLASMSDKDGACVTAQIPAILPRMRALIAVAHTSGCSETLLKDLNKFSSVVDGLGRRRNRIIHDPWFRKKDQNEFARLEVTADRRLVYELRPQSPDEIMDFVREITDAGKTFLKLRKRIHGDLKAFAKEQIEASHGKGSADFLDQLNQDNDTE